MRSGLVWTFSMNKNQRTVWAVTDAKAKLSEVLRCANTQGPQRIGTKSPCYVISEEDWRRLTGQKKSVGSWLMDNFAGIGKFELPDRADPPRDIPFFANEKEL